MHDDKSRNEDYAGRLPDTNQRVPMLCQGFKSDNLKVARGENSWTSVEMAPHHFQSSAKICQNISPMSCCNASQCGFMDSSDRYRALRRPIYWGIRQVCFALGSYTVDFLVSLSKVLIKYIGLGDSSAGFWLIDILDECKQEIIRGNLVCTAENGDTTDVTDILFPIGPKSI